MNRENVEQLISALKSGKYKRVEGQMRKTDPVTGEVCYCALGVAAHLSGYKWSSYSIHTMPYLAARRWLDLPGREFHDILRASDMHGFEAVIDHLNSLLSPDPSN